MVRCSTSLCCESTSMCCDHLEADSPKRTSVYPDRRSCLTSMCLCVVRNDQTVSPKKPAFSPKLLTSMTYVLREIARQPIHSVRNLIAARNFQKDGPRRRSIHPDHVGRLCAARNCKTVGPKRISFCPDPVRHRSNRTSDFAVEVLSS